MSPDLVTALRAETPAAPTNSASALPPSPPRPHRSGASRPARRILSFAVPVAAGLSLAIAWLRDSTRRSRRARPTRRSKPSAAPAQSLAPNTVDETADQAGALQGEPGHGAGDRPRAARMNTAPPHPRRRHGRAVSDDPAGAPHRAPPRQAFPSPSTTRRRSREKEPRPCGSASRSPACKPRSCSSAAWAESLPRTRRSPISSRASTSSRGASETSSAARRGAGAGGSNSRRRSPRSASSAQISRQAYATVNLDLTTHEPATPSATPGPSTPSRRSRNPPRRARRCTGADRCEPLHRAEHRGVLRQPCLPAPRRPAPAFQARASGRPRRTRTRRGSREDEPRCRRMRRRRRGRTACRTGGRARGPRRPSVPASTAGRS